MIELTVDLKNHDEQKRVVLKKGTTNTAIKAVRYNSKQALIKFIRESTDEFIKAINDMPEDKFRKDVFDDNE